MAILSTVHSFRLLPDGSGAVLEIETRDGPFSFSDPITEERVLFTLTPDELAKVWASHPDEAIASANTQIVALQQQVTILTATASREVEASAALVTAQGDLATAQATIADLRTQLEIATTPARTATATPPAAVVEPVTAPVKPAVETP